MLPVVLPEDTTRLFSYYAEGQLYAGMSYQQRLYRLIRSYGQQLRSEAYALGCELADEGTRTVVTVSNQHYKVWVELRSALAPEPADSMGGSGPTAIDSIRSWSSVPSDPSTPLNQAPQIA